MANIGRGISANAQTCPKIGVWKSTSPIPSDNNISNAGTENNNSDGVLPGCRLGGTGWHAFNSAGLEMVVSCFHVLGASGDVVYPDISARGCQLWKKVPTTCILNYQIPPCFYLSADMFTTGLGAIKGGVKPVAGNTNTDDVSFTLAPKNKGAMTSNLLNIGVVGAPKPPSLGLAIQFNGVTSCLQSGNVQLSSTVGKLLCVGKKCYPNIMTAVLPVAPGDSGSLVVTQVGNNPVGMLFACQTTSTTSCNSGIAWIIPIAQVMKDTGVATFDAAHLQQQMVQADPADQEEVAARTTIANNTWILKVPHVTGVQPGFTNGEIIIYVFVDKEEHLKDVEQKIPSRLSGFPVEVQPPAYGMDL